MKFSINNKYLIETSLKLLINFLLIRNLATHLGNQIRFFVISICVAINNAGNDNIVVNPIGKGIGTDIIKNVKKDKI